MGDQNTDIEVLISAFAYPLASMNESFYLRKRDLRVIGVHIFDHSLVSECKFDYDSGLSKNEERDVKEAIIAKEKDYETHILIPRLTKELRFEIMLEFIDYNLDFKDELKKNYKSLVDSTENYGIEFYKKGIKAGVEMEYLTNGLEDENLKSKWTKFYRNKIRTIALEWFEKEKNVV